MRLPRRRFLQLAAAATAFPSVPRIARAQSYPTKPVRVVVGFAPGGGNDIAARLISHWLSQRLGQQFIVENRPGAGSNIATEAVVRAAAGRIHASSGRGLQRGQCDALRQAQFQLHSRHRAGRGVLRVPNLVEVHPSVPVQTLPEFIAYAKANPGKVNMGSGGSGGPVHMTGELFNMMAGLKMQHVPYRGEAPALNDLIGGQVQVVFGSVPASIEYVRAGKLRALAVTTSTRSQLLPDVPTVAELVPGYESSTWYGIGAPKDTPAEIIDRLNVEINAALGDPTLKTRVADLGGTVIGGSPTDFSELIASDTEKWGKVVRFAGIKPE